MTRTDPVDVTASRALDAYLVLCARDGDRAAFEQLARRWDARLQAHAWRLTGQRDLAAEAAQGAWIEIARGLGRLQAPEAFGAWAYRIVSRQCARRIGGLRHDRALAGALAAQPEPVADEPAAASDIDRLRAAIRTLPAAQRAAVALFHFEDMSIAEVAVALDVPAGTVKTRLMHARRALRAVLEGEDHA
ncbi:MAG: RNA polymerase sigma factor [Caulobacter sp.]